VNADLHSLDVRSGDTLTLSWTDYTAGCRTPTGAPAIAVSMVAYEAAAGTFDPALDQRLLPGWTSCGAGEAPCARTTDNRYELAVDMPKAEVACTVQTDAVIGLPLAVVGPHGSFYTPVIRNDEGPNMLIGDTSFAAMPCSSPATTAPPPATTSPSTTSSIPTAATSATTAGPPGSGTPPVAAVLAAEAAQTTQPAAPKPATASGVLGATAQRTLAATGPRRGHELATLASILLLLGAVAVSTSYLVRRSQATRR
jgi:hypothetical protein